MKRPDLRDVVGQDVPPEELERLQRVHDLLLAAGPPPELPPALAEPPAGRARLGFLPRRRLGAALLLAAALAAAVFGAGYLAGHRGGGGFSATFAVSMHGTAAAPQALASIQVGHRDRSGNWPLLVRVRGLRPLPKGDYYELFLTRGHRPAVSCGTFATHSGTTTVRLNAPYRLKSYDGWVVTAGGPGQPESKSRRILLTT